MGKRLLVSANLLVCLNWFPFFLIVLSQLSPDRHTLSTGLLMDLFNSSGRMHTECNKGSYL